MRIEVIMLQLRFKAHFFSSTDGIFDCTFFAFKIQYNY